MKKREYYFEIVKPFMNELIWDDRERCGFVAEVSPSGSFGLSQIFDPTHPTHAKYQCGPWPWEKTMRTLWRLFCHKSGRYYEA
jgi:hypothetical protein